MHKLTIFLLVLIAMVAFIQPLQAHAQSEPGIQSMKIELWPEYDRQSMLVIHRFILSDDTQLPVQLTMRMPADAGQPHAVAVGSTDQTVGDVPFDVKIDGEWAEVSFLASMPAVQFEYYDPDLKIQGNARNFDFSWLSTYPVDFLVVEVQQPTGATEMKISPNTGAGEPRQDGLTYYTSQVGAIGQGQNINFSIKYNKSNNELSVTSMEVEPSKPLDEDTAGRSQTSNPALWAAIFVGVAMIAGGAYWYWQSGRTVETRTSSRKRQRSSKANRPVSTQPAGEAVYCPQCGNRSNPADRFCRACGARLRTE